MRQLDLGDSKIPDGLKPAEALVADRGYDARAVIDMGETRGGRAHIPIQRDRKVQRSIDPAIYRQRNIVERYFCKLKYFRRTATRCDKLVRIFSPPCYSLKTPLAQGL